MRSYTFSNAYFVAQRCQKENFNKIKNSKPHTHAHTDVCRTCNKTTNIGKEMRE